jgi:hypothetical protein
MPAAIHTCHAVFRAIYNISIIQLWGTMDEQATDH